ncbi:hypothetical protein LXL04_038123 [Taraxacum kok-saghyz]
MNVVCSLHIDYHCTSPATPDFPPPAISERSPATGEPPSGDLPSSRRRQPSLQPTTTSLQQLFLMDVFRRRR